MPGWRSYVHRIRHANAKSLTTENLTASAKDKGYFSPTAYANGQINAWSASLVTRKMEIKAKDAALQCDGLLTKQKAEERKQVLMRVHPV